MCLVEISSKLKCENVVLPRSRFDPYLDLIQKSIEAFDLYL